MGVEDIIARGKDRLEVSDVIRRGQGTGRGKLSLAEAVIEGMGLEGFPVLVGFDDLFVFDVRHRDEAEAILFRDRRGDIAIGVDKYF